MMNTRPPGRTVVLLVVAVAMAGTVALQSAPAPLLTIERMGESSVRLTWTDDEPGFVLQEIERFQESGLWRAASMPPQPLDGRLGVTLPIQTNGSRLFRLKSRGVEFSNHQEVVGWSSGGTVDTSIFLTGESIKDPHKLNWTISSNAVGATIGPGGVVSLGTGIGSFTVTASATNGAWQDSFTLHAIRLEFSTASSVLSWQPNGTFNARALLNGPTDPALLDWSISGSPAALINALGVVTLGSGGGSYTIQATAKGTMGYSDTMTLNAVEVRLVSIGFVDAGEGNGGDNQHVLYENADPQGWGDGGAITNPVWIAGAPGADAPPVRNAPVCYTSSGTGGSKARVQVVVNIQPAGQTLNFIGLDQSADYFRTNGILSAGADQIIDMVASVPLPATMEKFTKTFAWQAVFPDGGSWFVCPAGQSTQTLYTVYAAPITSVEAQANNPTPNRLDFCIVGVAEGFSNKLDVCYQIAAKVRDMTGVTFGAMPQNPRWKFYAEPSPRELDCHHRAALAASAFGVLGIQGYVHRVYSTCHPVPAAPPWFPFNSTPNDYLGTYTSSHRLKYRQPGPDVHRLIFAGNNFEGCVRVEDGSADDGNMWWTIWPLERYENAKALIIGFSAQVPELWESLDGTFVADETVPVDQLADKPKLLGGPD